MISTVSIYEMNLIVNCEHKVRTRFWVCMRCYMMHREVVAVRSVSSRAKELYVIDKNDENAVYKADRIHEDGFFETVIEDRHKWFDYKFRIVYWDGNENITADAYSFRRR